MKGPCYPASEAIFHLMGGKNQGLTPMQIIHEGISHWYLKWEIENEIFYIDPTSSQFNTPVPYEQGKGKGFLTKEPSKRSKKFIK